MNNEIEDASVGTLVLSEDNKRFLLVKNRGGPKEISPGKFFDKPEGWGLPNGRWKPGDKTFFDTAYRETREETGGLHIDIDRNPRLRVERLAKNHKRIAFIGYPVAGEIGTPEDNQILEVRWFSTKILWVEDPTNEDYVNIYPAHRQMAQELLRKLGR